jgi:hypothetical protein
MVFPRPAEKEKPKKRQRMKDGEALVIREKKKAGDGVEQG